MTDKKSKYFYGYIVLVAAFISRLVMYGPRESYGVFFKPMQADFDWSRALISGAYSASVIVQGLVAIIMGGLNDRLGPRVVITLCGVLIGAGYLLMSQVNFAWQLYLFYVLVVGVGMGGNFAPLLSTVARWFVKKRSMVTGIVIAGGGIGVIIASPVANWLISKYEWRISYLILGALVLIIILIAAQFLKRDPAKMGQVPYGENEEKEHRLETATEEFTLLEATHTRQLWMEIAMMFCFGLCGATIIVHIVPHATDLGISTTTAANILASRGMAILTGGIIMGVVADRIGRRQSFAVCFVLMSAAFFWLFVATEVWMLYLFIIVFGFSSGGLASLQSPLIAELFGMTSHGLILGVSAFSYTVGAAIGPFLAGYVFDISGSYQVSFIVCVVASVTGLMLAVTLRPVKKPGNITGVPLSRFQ
ncbi:MFS transporter [Chloroflexota bacterium]